MLPPIIPLSAAPVTSQQDPVKPTPDIKPVVPTQPASGESAIDLKQQRDPQAQALLLRDEQRRQQQRGKQGGQDRYSALPGEEVNADNTVPVAPLMDEHVRQGLLVDIEV
ncbi:aspartate-semialdehyde dehydrogenase [Pseudomonas putida]|uniref:aspartate-semialdehyde dehydrogenase n=1 Tax=Pseudomonas TaxID=286 RepID=UPI001198C2BB|nr:aspartate-semialdehyde dehydrogenase [Pseudomonas putida]EKT4559236.1 aspartate-semialdehyde dehydrogenase [Pseudomonas putida]MDP9537814.1 aspartate-semialdehyde dehydrogenase [Pseudomonas putida]QDY37336.1 aspartate-semialdehyde dehydrogenase [Pseudomonas putida]